MPESNHKIIALYNVYNDAEIFRESLESVKSIADAIAVADGAYEKFPYEGGALSDDDTRKIAWEYADYYLQCSQEKPWKGEAHKRTALLNMVPDDWWALRIDADEIVEKFDRSQLDREEDVVIAQMKTYRNPEEVEKKRGRSVLYRPGHDWFYKEKDALYKGGSSISNLKRVQTDLIVIGHHPYRRPEDRLDKRIEYRDRVDQHTSDPRDWNG